MPKTTVLINKNGMGNADQELQHKLITTYLQMLVEGEPERLPAAICLYAEGVRLAVTGSPVIAQLKKLEEKGVTLILCSTCLGHLNLREQVEVGIAGGMHDIMEAQYLADKVITL